MMVISLETIYCTSLLKARLIYLRKENFSMNKNIAILFLSFIAFGLHAQDYIFKVMANKGTNMSRSSSAESWKPLKRGDVLYSGYWVKVVNEAYLGLVHYSGKTAALQSPGEFTIEKIELSIKEKKKGLGAKYTDFVFSTMTENNLYEEEKLITRGSEEIILELPRDAEVIHSKIHLHWKPLEDFNSYIVTVTGIFDDVLTRVEVEGNHFVLDLTDDLMKNEQSFVVVISVNGEEYIQSKDHIIDRVTNEELKQMVVKPDESNLTTSMDFVLIAAFYEENNFLIDASNFYQEAMILSPEVDDFRELYEDFLKRHNWR